MNIVSKATWGLGSVSVLALAAAWWLTAPPTPSDPGGDESEQAEAVEDVAVEQAKTAIAQIEAESATGSVGHAPQERIEAPPAFVPVDGPNDAQVTPDVPAGFEVTTFHGEMSKARMTAVDAAELPDPLAELSWLAGGVDGLAAQAMASGRDWTFGWVAIDPDADVAVLGQRLEEMGAEVLGRSGRLLRARLPGQIARLDAIAALAGVAGLGSTPLEAKLPAPRNPNTGFLAVDGLVPTFVTLMADDPNGRWRQALTDLGGVVGAFDPAIRMYAANFPSAVLETVAAADFVMSVEPVRVVKAAHSTAVPAMGADALRTYDAGSGPLLRDRRWIGTHRGDGLRSEHPPRGHRHRPSQHLRREFRDVLRFLQTARRIRISGSIRACTERTSPARSWAMAPAAHSMPGWPRWSRTFASPRC